MIPISCMSPGCADPRLHLGHLSSFLGERQALCMPPLHRHAHHAASAGEGTP